MPASFLNSTPQLGHGASLVKTPASDRRQHKNRLLSFLSPHAPRHTGVQAQQSHVQAPSTSCAKLLSALSSISHNTDQVESRPPQLKKFDQLVEIPELSNDAFTTAYTLEHHPEPVITKSSTANAQMASVAMPPGAPVLDGKDSPSRYRPDLLSYQPPHRREAMAALPPHLRQPTSAARPDEKKAAAKLTIAVDKPTHNIVDRLAHFGVKVTSPTSPTINSISRRSSNKENPTTKTATTSAPHQSAAAPPKSKPPKKAINESRRARLHDHERLPKARDTRWPSKNDFPVPNPKYKYTWKSTSSRVESLGDSSDREAARRTQQEPEEVNGFRLADFDGKWAPPPIDWDGRPGFRKDQSEQHIERWQKSVAKLTPDLESSIVVIDSIDLPCGETLSFANESLDDGRALLADMAPRYWKPTPDETFVGFSTASFWREVCASETPLPVDPGDLNSAVPWWETYLMPDRLFLKQPSSPSVSGVDPDESSKEREAREKDQGSDWHIATCKHAARAKNDAKRERKQKKKDQRANQPIISDSVYGTDRIKPGLNLYVRSARQADMAEVCDIYNYYVEYGCCTSEVKRLSTNGMLHRYRNIAEQKLPFLVACERRSTLPARKKRNQGEQVVLSERIVGFAYADDYNDPSGMYRFTAEAEVYTLFSEYMKGVGKCLMDKLLGVLDQSYIERAGFEAEGTEINGCGRWRCIKDIIINLPYDKPEKLEWMSRWITGWLGFEQVGHMKEIGVKNDKFINLATFQRRTGYNLDPKLAPR